MIRLTACAVALAMAGTVAADGVVTFGPGGGGDTCATATEITSVPFSDVGTTCGFNDDYDEICPYDAPGSPDVVYRLIPDEDMVIDISLCTDSAYDTKLYVYNGFCPEYQSGDYRRCNEDACSTPSFSSPYVSRIDGLPVRTNIPYFIVIDGFDGDCGAYTLDIETVPIPTCTSDALFGQDPEITDLWILGVSDTDANFIRYESFSGVSEPICSVVWYGIMTNDFQPNVFTVSFYTSVGGQPGTLIATQQEQVTGEELGIYYVTDFGTYELQRWVMEFAPCVTQSLGWISIQGTSDSPGYYFWWLSSHLDGNGHISDGGSGFQVVAWDLSLCLYGDGGCGDSAAGNCYVTNGSPACRDLHCCLTVCAIDPFCCETEWDGNCGYLAGQFCGDCGDADAGSCFEDNATPGCDDGGCCQAVCILDDFCCNVEWDGLCAQEALDNCSGPCCMPTGECIDDVTAGDCIAMGGVFELAGTLCSDTVCPFPACPSTGACYVEHDSSGCNDEDCCNIVCNVDSFCCTTLWDDICAGEAAELCGNCGGSLSGSCFTDNGSPGCDDADCCETICALDSFCCESAWDEVCAEQALEICGCPCDNDGDGDVDVDDLLVILGGWGTTTGDCTGDGVTDVDDLLAVLGQWGACG